MSDASPVIAPGIFVKGFSRGTPEEDIRALFERFGSITRLYARNDRRFAIIDFASRDSVHAALAAGPYELEGEELEVAEKQDRPPRSPKQRAARTGENGDASAVETMPDSVIVKNLPLDVTVEELTELMGGFGTITRTKLRKSRGFRDREPRVFAFVTYEEPQAADSASSSSNLNLRGNDLEVEHRRRPPRRSPRRSPRRPSGSRARRGRGGSSATDAAVDAAAGAGAGAAAGAGGSSVVPNSIVVKNLTSEVSQDDVRMMFSEFGEVVNIGSNPRGTVCFIEFSSQDAADAAVGSGPHEIASVPLVVELRLAKKRRSTPPRRTSPKARPNDASAAAPAPRRERPRGPGLFVGNVPTDANAKQLRELFSPVNVREVNIRRGRPAAFVTFDNTSAVDNAVARPPAVDGREVRVEPRRSKRRVPDGAESPDVSTSVAVLGLEDGLTEDQLRAAFAPFGRVTEVVLIHSRARAFVDLDSREDLERVLAGAPYSLNGAQLNVEESRMRTGQVRRRRRRRLSGPRQ